MSIEFRPTSYSSKRPHECEIASPAVRLKGIDFEIFCTWLKAAEVPEPCETEVHQETYDVSFCMPELDRDARRRVMESFVLWARVGRLQDYMKPSMRARRIGINLCMDVDDWCVWLRMYAISETSNREDIFRIYGKKEEKVAEQPATNKDGCLGPVLANLRSRVLQSVERARR